MGWIGASSAILAGEVFFGLGDRAVPDGVELFIPLVLSQTFALKRHYPEALWAKEGKMEQPVKRPQIEDTWRPEEERVDDR